MEKHIIESKKCTFTNPQTNYLEEGVFLKQNIQAFYHADYHSGDEIQRKTYGTVEHIITTLKNQFQGEKREYLEKVGNSLIRILKEDFTNIFHILKV